MKKILSAEAAALFFSAMLHAAIGGGLYYAGKSADAPGKPEAEAGAVYGVELAYLPRIDKIGAKSAAAKSERERAALPAEEFGLKARGNSGAGDEDYEMLKYNDAVKERIERFRQYPAEARLNGIEGRARVGFSLRKNGELSGVYLLESSGSASLDREAVENIRRAGPFPPLPESHGGDGSEMSVAIIYRLGGRE